MMFRGAQESNNCEPAGAERAESPTVQRELRRWWKGVWLFLMLLASVEFIARGPSRTLSFSGDFIGAYISSKAWLRGANPYDHNLLDQLWEGENVASKNSLLQFNRPMVYPPTALLLIAPLAFANWPAAGVWLLTINSLLALAAIAALMASAGLNWREPRGGLFLVLGIAFAPLHSGIALGNLTVPAAAIAIIAVYASAKKRDLLAGVLLAIATGLKPHIGGAVLLGYAIERRWRICAAAGILLLGLASLSVLRLEIAGVDWRQSWLSSSAEFVAPGGSNDPTAANKFRHQLINLHWPLYTIFDHAWEVNSIVLFFVGGLLLICLLTRQRTQTSQQELLSISLLAVLSLLVIYHRFYDAVLLLLPLAWSLAAWNGRLKLTARLVFLLILPFLIPGAVMLRESARAGGWPSMFDGDRWWEILVLPHQVWAVVLMAVCLVYALSHSTNYHSQFSQQK